MDQDEKISAQLEQARLKLYQLVFRYGILHRKVIRQSVVVDRLINRYNMIKYNEKPKPLMNRF
ncbi:MAG: aspartyl-phosphate phosphatase Spo0E family protein [Gorillibacterium sp.]|nr:aspartyl-phosphate phosphatase Spo0E family protein [Gorillibacterium sp.]